MTFRQVLDENKLFFINNLFSIITSKMELQKTYRLRVLIFVNFLLVFSHFSIFRALFQRLREFLF